MSLPYRGENITKEVTHKKIDSAGTGALVDKPADKSAQAVAMKNELSLEGHLEGNTLQQWKGI